MKLPYGIMNFKRIRDENRLYVDKTRFIAMLEEEDNPYPFFIRPRRFGKSLFLSLLEHYYDILYKEEFHHLFGDLYIGNQPTAQRNNMVVLSLDFSGLETKNEELFKESFRKNVLNRMIDFLYSHETLFSRISPGPIIEKLEKEKDIKSLVDMFLTQIKRTGKEVCLLIDEYDHFANDIIAMGTGSYYKKLVRAKGFVRDFYEAVKEGAKRNINRVFITGISPVMLDDLTSGYNISLDFTTSCKYNEMMGFTETEVRGILQTLGLEKRISVEDLRRYYDGYLFNIKAKERVYNPDMVLYYLTRWKEMGAPPAEIVDENVKTDYGRLQRLIKNVKNKEQLHQIIQEEKIKATLVKRFSFDLMYERKYFTSLLFYMGFLTFMYEERQLTYLGIPNYVIKTLFWEYFRELLHKEYTLEIDTSQIETAISALAFDGEVKPFIELIREKILSALSRRDYIKFNEKYIKMVLFSFLSLNPLYRLQSEPEVKGGFIDIYLERDNRFPDVEYEWLWELKYIKKEQSLEDVKAEGLEQLNRYAQSPRFRGKKNLKKALLIFRGKNECDVYEE
jgi:hypothetical protein